MITFQQTCEWQTHNQHYSWFLIPKYLWDLVEVEDKQLVFAESTRDNNELRLWYPREKFFSRKMDAEERNRLIQQALDNGEIDVVVSLKKGVGM